MNAQEAGRAFLAEVLALIPEDQQAAARAALEASTQALETLGAGYLRQSEFSRQMDQLRGEQQRLEQWRGELDSWWNDHKTKLEEYERIKAGGGNPNPNPNPNPGNPNPSPSPSPGTFSREDFLRELEAREAAAVGAIVTTNMLSAKHFKEFGEVLDVGALLRDPRIKDLGLQGVYEATFKERYEQRAKEAEDKRINELVQARLLEERKKAPLPYPVSGREPHFLDALETKQGVPPADPAKPGETPTPAMSVVDAAVAEFHRLQAERMGGAA